MTQSYTLLKLVIIIIVDVVAEVVVIMVSTTDWVLIQSLYEVLHMHY